MPEKRKIENVKKHLAYLHDSSEYVIHTINLKQALNHGLVLKKFHRVIKFNQNSWLKPYIYIYIYVNADLTKIAKINFERRFQSDELCSFWKNDGKYEKT